MPRQKPLGRLLRSNPLTARGLTEIRVHQLQRSETQGDFAFCMQYAKRGSLAVDVGANVGNWAMGLSKAVGRGGKVIALEPNPTVYRELKQSTWGSNVSAHLLAASDESDDGVLEIPLDRRGAEQGQLASLEPRASAVSTKRIPVRRARLDDLLRGSVLPVSLIKVDVEGHELAVLDGAQKVMARHRPVLVIEIEERHLLHHSVEDVVGWIKEHGYECHAIRGRSLVPWRDFDIVRDQRQYFARLRPGEAKRQPIEYVNNFLFRPLPE